MRLVKNIAAVILILVAAFLIWLPAPLSAYAQSVPTVQDDGTGNQYSTLPVNYVQIRDLDFAHALIEAGSGYSIENGYIGAADQYRTNLVWTGKLSYGSRNTDNDRDAVLKMNYLPDVTVRFPAGAVLSDGTECDIRLMLSEVTVGLGASRTSRITDNTTVKTIIAGGWGSLSSAPPRTNISVRNATADNGINSGATIANRYKVTMQIVHRGTNTPVASAYPSMLVEFRDLDVLDKTIRKSASAQILGNGTYAEGIELADGWIGSAVMAPSTGDLANTLLAETQTTAGGNTKIKVNGAMIRAFEERFNPPSSDFDTLWSGFIAAVRPQGFSFYWTGSIAGGKSTHGGMGTTIGGQPTVAVKANRHSPGAETAQLGGAGTFSGLDSWYTNTHLMNSSAVYSYTPASGWYVKSLKVDGEEQLLTDDQRKNGGSYIFERLNKYPLAERDIRNGHVLIARESGFYTIETNYAHLPEYRDSKISDTAYIRAYDDKEITYRIRCDEIWNDASAGEHRICDDMAGGLLVLSGEPEVTVTGGSYVRNKADNSGLDYVFKSYDADGIRPSMVITYKARVNWDAYFASDKIVIRNVCNGNETETGVLSGMKITKAVTGRLRDTTKAFRFTVSMSGLEPGKVYAAGSGAEFGTGGGAEITGAETGRVTDNGFAADRDGKAIISICMKGGQGIGIRDVPVGAKYTVAEDASDHRPSYIQKADGSFPVFVRSEDNRNANWMPLSTEEETLDKTDGEVTVAFTNNRDPVAVTGLLRNAGAPAALAAILCAAVLILIRGRYAQRGGR